MNRREMLELMGSATAGLLHAGYTARAFGYPNNEKLNVGCIGTGGRCRKLMQTLQRVPGVRLAAVE